MPVYTLDTSDDPVNAAMPVYLLSAQEFGHAYTQQAIPGRYAPTLLVDVWTDRVVFSRKFVFDTLISFDHATIYPEAMIWLHTLTFDSAEHRPIPWGFWSFLYLMASAGMPPDRAQSALVDLIWQLAAIDDTLDAKLMQYYPKFTEHQRQTRSKYRAETLLAGAISAVVPACQYYHNQAGRAEMEGPYCDAAQARQAKDHAADLRQRIQDLRRLREDLPAHWSTAVCAIFDNAITVFEAEATRLDLYTDTQTVVATLKQAVARDPAYPGGTP